MLAPTASSLSSAASAHDDFLPLAAVVARHAQVVFRGLRHEAREEAVAEAVAAAFESFVRLKARGKDPARDFPSQMAHYGVLHVKDGRHVGGRLSTRDVLSKKARQRHGFRVVSLPVSTRRHHEDIYGNVGGQRRLDEFEEQLRDNTRTPPDEQAAFRVDLAAWLKTWGDRDRRLIVDMARGERTLDLAGKYRLSPGRVSQKRLQYRGDWLRFVGDLPARCKRAKAVTA